MPGKATYFARVACLVMNDHEWRVGGAYIISPPGQYGIR